MLERLDEGLDMHVGAAAASVAERKANGVYFTPQPIATFLCEWAIAGRAEATVLDPNCGEGAFLEAAGENLIELGAASRSLEDQVAGIELHGPYLERAEAQLEVKGLGARLIHRDFFDVDSPNDGSDSLPRFDAVVGNPPYVRYQLHAGETRKAAASRALQEGVRLSGLASSWAASLVHAGAFLSPGGRLAMVLPAELLSVGYAEPVRMWMRKRFAAVKLILFENLQFPGASENVVLVLAQGTGGCDAFSLYSVSDSAELVNIQRFEEYAVRLNDSGKWTDLTLTLSQRQLFKSILESGFTELGSYGSPNLGTVTGANGFFTLDEATRARFQLRDGVEVQPVSPPGSRHLKGLKFTIADWKALRDDGQRVWILNPQGDEHSDGLIQYLAMGEEAGIPNGYKCRVRSTWWRPPVAQPPDLFFTYMSHRFPKLISNRARVTFVNSMHGIYLDADLPKAVRDGLPLLSLNSVTLLGAELFGRSYGGGILKMEPREASRLPAPELDVLCRAWEVLKSERDSLDRSLRNGMWTNVVARVDEVLLGSSLGLDPQSVSTIHEAARQLRSRRMARTKAGPRAGKDDS